MFILFFFISNVSAVYLFAECVCIYALDKLRNTEGINHCHLAAQNVTHVARAWVHRTTSEPFLAYSNLDESQTLSIHKSMRERKSERRQRWVGGGCCCGCWGQALLCFCNLTQIYVYTFTNEKSKSATSVLIFPMAMATCLELQPPFGSRLLQQLFRWMIKVKAQQARVSPLLFKEEWKSCHLLMHCLPSRMQTRHPHSTSAAQLPLSSLLFSSVPPFLLDVSQKSCLGLLIRCCGIAADMWEVCPPSHPSKDTPACWSDVISKIGGTREDYWTQLIYGHWSQAPESKIL